MFRRPRLGEHRRTVFTWLGEVVLIVAGVLLALMLDEARQTRAREASAVEALSAIREELDENRELTLEAREYHDGRAEHIRQALVAGEALHPRDFPRGFTSPARLLDAAWVTAREAGELSAVDRELRRRIAVAYASQHRYEQQISSVSGLIYQTLFEGGRDGMVRNPEGLLMVISAFAWREAEIVGVLGRTVALIDSAAFAGESP